MPAAPPCQTPPSLSPTSDAADPLYHFRIERHLRLQRGSPGHLHASHPGQRLCPCRPHPHRARHPGLLTLAVPLNLGSETTVVQVNADAPLVDPSTASVSTDLSQRQLEDVPILGRNPYLTAKLSGVFVNTGNQQVVRFADQNGTSQTSVAGGPVTANLYLVEGVPITDTNNRPIVIPTIESIQDVKVQANTYDAQVGRTGGGVFNTLLRSGSDQFHGSLFGETRQTSWLANDFFANREGIPRPDSPYYNWGASLGGFVPVTHRARTSFSSRPKATFRPRPTPRPLPSQRLSSARATSPFGNAPRTLSLRGPGQANWYISVFKNVLIWELGQRPVSGRNVQHVQHSLVQRP